MLAFVWNSTGSQRTTESVRIEEVGSDNDGRRTSIQKLQARFLTSGLCLVANGDANHVTTLDLVGDQHFGLFVGGKERQMS